MSTSSSSFLDHAWTGAYPKSNQPVKQSKAHRKQNRCCDQCRKGKRACDATILEDSLLETNGNCPKDQRVFHYSDIYGALAPCSNCEKTRKKCTFEWLRSQRISQAVSQSQASLPLKKRRKSNSSPGARTQIETKIQEGHDLNVDNLASADPNTIPVDFFGFLDERTSDTILGSGTIEGDNLEWILPEALGDNPILVSEIQSTSQTRGAYINGNEVYQWEEDSGYGAMADSPPLAGIRGLGHLEIEGHAQESGKNSDSHILGGLSSAQTERKRRRLSEITFSNASSSPPLLLLHHLSTTIDKVRITDGLFEIYHDVVENALSCWLTERTCPYNKNPKVTSIDKGEKGWSDRMYYRVFRLDRLADTIRGRNLTKKEDQIASKAINSVIVSFATQWSQPLDPKTKGKHPSCGGDLAGCGNDGISDPDSSFYETGKKGVQMSPLPQHFDRKLQIASWHEARKALQEAERIESFRVVFAQLIFSLTQRPLDGGPGVTAEINVAGEVESSSAEENGFYHAEDKAVSECDKLLSKLNLTIESEGPPVHLEQGVRLIHSLRSRMNMAGVLGRDVFTEVQHSRRDKHPHPPLNRIDSADRATVDLLFWLGITFDTLSSAMYKKPLVVSDEDSDVWLSETLHTPQDLNQEECSGKSSARTDGLWEDYLLHRDNKKAPLRWPCSEKTAAQLLCDAAPIKVLLFRKVTRLQTLLSRNAHSQKLEKAMSEALDVCSYWGKVYAPFLQDCVLHHDRLPPKIQSWCTGLAGHWHLASLLFVDLVEIIDNAGLSLQPDRQRRASTNFVTRYREKNCYALSDLAKCACQENSDNNHHRRALLTEPWTVVLIRAFAKAGTLLLFSGWASCTKGPIPTYDEEPFRRAEDCVTALWYLGRKSDMALQAAEALGAALKKKRTACEIVVDSMQQFLNYELWEGSENFETSFSAESLLVS
ncbi:hypothetical protein GQ43DRAFT_469332 [Delitschia confertaspora ATCC 74209]|uniref:Zn(2)-C6 fungal-type domain-containing protein n=1 Tax=Delitschia confertaspora ATCC 74209 TaxID=1513339 RepID=A0A9P4JVE5_9PLEO|nr:hypothetical protein GQ43DRAFT_469332 [Delitschia confertaspora ATCC 74209]